MSRLPVKARQLEIMEKGLAAKGPIEMDEALLAQTEEKLKKNPKDFCAWVARGILYFNEDFQKAIESFSEALAIHPFNADQYYNRGRKLLSQDRYVQALADLVLSTRIDSRDAWKWHFLGVAYFFLDRYEEAIDAFQKGIDMHKFNHTNNTPPEIDWIYMSYMRMGKPDEALKVLDEVSADMPVEAGDLMYLKRCLLYKGVTTLEEFDAQIDRSMAKRIITEVYGAAVYCHYVLKDDEKAVKYLDEILAVKEDHHAWGYKLALQERDLWGAEAKK